MNCLWEPHVSQARHHLLRETVPFLAWEWARDLGLSMEGLEKTGCQMWGVNIQELGWQTVSHTCRGWLTEVRV